MTHLITQSTKPHSIRRPPDIEAARAAPARWAPTAAWAAVAWAMGFAAVNLWLQWNLPPDAEISQYATGFTVLNLFSISLKVFGSGVALAIAYPWGRRFPSWMLTTCSTGAASTLLFYGTVVTIFLTATGNLTGVGELAGGAFAAPGFVYAGFFLLGGVPFAALAHDIRRRAPVARRWTVLGIAGAPVLLGIVIVGVPTLLRALGLFPA